jgi:hypothetical protein
VIVAVTATRSRLKFLRRHEFNERLGEIVKRRG